MKFTIIVLAFNEEKFIARCLRSLIFQKTQFEFEIIVVNDASTDATLDILERIATNESNIRIINMESNSGIGACAQKGLENVNTQYFTRVDGDDFVSEYFIQIMGMAITGRRLNAVSCDYYITDENSEIIGYGSTTKRAIACGVFYDKDFLIQLGGYNKSLSIYEDIDLNNRLKNATNIVNVPIPLYRYRAHGSNTTGIKEVIGHIT